MMLIFKFLTLFIYLIIITSSCAIGKGDYYTSVLDIMIWVLIGFIPMTIKGVSSRKLILVYTPLFFYSLFNWYHYYVYKNVITGSFFAELYYRYQESNIYEKIESLWGYGIIILLMFILYAIFVFAKTYEINNKLKVLLYVFVASAMLVGLKVFVDKDKLAQRLLVDNPYIGWVYKVKQGRSKLFEIESIVQDEVRRNVKFIRSFSEKDSFVHVIVYGGLTNKSKWSLYGNKVITNIELEQIDNLYVFEDMITPTINSMDNRKYAAYVKIENNRKNIIQILNQIGIETYFISNMPRYDQYIVNGVMSESATNKVFFNYHENNLSFDMKVVEEIDAKIKKDRKIVIFVSLMGIIPPYQKRYPYSFGEFPDGDLENGDNTYNNALQFQDKIIARIIKILRNKDLCSFLVYLADGAEVFDREKLKKENYEIPFLLWLSKKYIAKNQKMEQRLREITSKPFSTVEVPQSLLKLIGIEVDKVNFFDIRERKQNRIVIDPSQNYINFKNIE